jgi:ubiquitin-like 1-activating enzyme E1 A
MDAQARIQNANILLINLRGLANEIAKNLVLAGVGSLTILDNASVTEVDLGAQFFLGEKDEVVGKNRAEAARPNIQKLNPRVRVHIDTEGVTTKGPSYFAAFDIVVATDLDPTAFNLVNVATRVNHKPFYAAGTHGMYGFIFSDLIQHTYVIERDLGNVATQPGQETRTRSIVDVKTRKEGPKTIESVTKTELYSTWFLASDLANLPEEYLNSKRRLRSVNPALSCLRALWEFMQINGRRLPSNREDLKMFTQIATQKHKALSLPSETLSSEFLRQFLQNLGSEIAPVTAILGGQLAQDVINVLGQKQQPIQNMVIFDGTSMEASMYALHTPDALGSSQTAVADAPLPSNGSGMMMQTGLDGTVDGMGGLHNMHGMPILTDPNSMMAMNSFANPVMGNGMFIGDMSMAGQMPLAFNGLSSAQQFPTIDGSAQFPALSGPDSTTDFAAQASIAAAVPAQPQLPGGNTSDAPKADKEPSAQLAAEGETTVAEQPRKD